jgi:hypothetical protein
LPEWCCVKAGSGECDISVVFDGGWLKTQSDKQQCRTSSLLKKHLIPPCIFYTIFHSTELAYLNDSTCIGIKKYVINNSARLPYLSLPGIKYCTEVALL